MVISAIGYKSREEKVHIQKGHPIKGTYHLQTDQQQLEEVTVVSKGIHRVRRSAYNAIAIDMDALQGSSSNLNEALNKAPGIRLRESGGVGSENQLTLDGFTGKHVKVFIDGVPQEGVGSSFNINNLPISFAERIEVYKGVVPIGFGTDALGGVINIVTNKKNVVGFWILPIVMVLSTPTNHMSTSVRHSKTDLRMKSTHFRIILTIVITWITQ